LRLATIGAVLVAAALLLAACGSSKKSSSTSAAPASTTSTSTTPATTPAKTQELETYDFRFDPKTVKAKPGQKVTLELKNEGKVEHNFSVSSLHIDKDLEAGKKAKVTLTVPKSGNLQFFCRYHKVSHNMVGSFAVAGASSGSGSTGTSTGTSTGGSSGGGY
jgi:plastocyanin